MDWCLRLGRSAPAPPPPPPHERDWHWQLKNELPALTGFNERVQAALSAAPPPQPDEATISTLLLILDELLTNVIKYAHPGEDPGHRLMDVHIELEADAIRLAIIDDGIPFDPTIDNSRAKEQADLELEDRAIGGWGLSLVRKLADSMRHQRVGEHNQLTLYKRFGTAQIPPA